MKKLLICLLLATLSAPAFAGSQCQVTLNLSNDLPSGGSVFINLIDDTHSGQLASGKQLPVIFNLNGSAMNGGTIDGIAFSGSEVTIYHAESPWVDFEMSGGNITATYTPGIYPAPPKTVGLKPTVLPSGQCQLSLPGSTSPVTGLMLHISNAGPFQVVSNITTVP